jgi:hypothetical protein
MAIYNPIVDKNYTTDIVTPSIDRTSKFLSVAITVLLMVGAIFFLFNLVMAGIAFMSSNGDEKQLSAAKSKIMGALIGLIVIFSVYAVLALFNIVFDIDLINFPIPTL